MWWPQQACCELRAAMLELTCGKCCCWTEARGPLSPVAHSSSRQNHQCATGFNFRIMRMLPASQNRLEQRSERQQIECSCRRGRQVPVSCTSICPASPASDRSGRFERDAAHRHCPSANGTAAHGLATDGATTRLVTAMHTQPGSHRTFTANAPGTSSTPFGPSVVVETVPSAVRRISTVAVPSSW